MTAVLDWDAIEKPYGCTALTLAGLQPDDAEKLQGAVSCERLDHHKNLGRAFDLPVNTRRE